MKEKAQERLEGMLQTAGVEASVTICAADVERALRELVRAEGADVILTNRRRPDGVLTLVGVNADVTDTVRLSPRPVISA